MDMVTYAALQKQMQEIGKDIAVPTKVSAFENDAGYALTADVNAALAEKQSKLTFDMKPKLRSMNPVTSDGIKTAIENAIASAPEVFVVHFHFDGIAFNLTAESYVAILGELRAGRRVIGRVVLDDSAGMGGSGEFDFPVNHVTEDSQIVFTFNTLLTNVEIVVNSDNSVTHLVRKLQDKESRVDFITDFSSPESYPSANAVYDFVIARTGGLTFKVSDTVPTVDNRSVITFVIGG